MVTIVNGPPFDGLFPACVSATGLFAGSEHIALFPQEAEIIAGAVDKRRREFAAVRLCARKSLVRLGIAPRPIVPIADGPSWADRAPGWPAGIVGSMTHCEGFQAAAVARRVDIASIGLDAEPNSAVSPEVQELVMLPEERARLTDLRAARPGVAWDRMIFSAKESVYKAWYPLTGQWLDFGDCLISVDPERGTFTGTLKVPGPILDDARLSAFTGNWRILDGPDAGFVVTAVVVRPQNSSAKVW